MTDKGILNHRYPTAPRHGCQPVLSQLLLRGTPPSISMAPRPERSRIPSPCPTSRNRISIPSTGRGIRIQGRNTQDTEKQDRSQPYWASSAIPIISSPLFPLLPLLSLLPLFSLYLFFLFTSSLSFSASSLFPTASSS